MKVDLELLKLLRKETGAGYLDCKKALLESESIDAAKEWLRIKGIYNVERIASRPTGEGVIGHYVHVGNKIAALVELNCETDFVAMNSDFLDLAHNLAMHIAATNPKYMNRSNVPQSDLEKEESVLRKELIADGKPENFIERIVEGRMAKFYERNCLMEQIFVKDDSKTINEVLRDAVNRFGENIRVERFVRYVVSE